MGQRIKDINLEQIEEYSLHLAHKVSNSGWIPDHILYVERAGIIRRPCCFQTILIAASAEFIADEAALFLNPR